MRSVKTKTDAPSVWVVAGNIVDERAGGPDGTETLHGTRLYRPNAKIYLASLRHSWSLLTGASDESIEIIGQHRKSRKWIMSWVRVSYTTNWRIQVLYDPSGVARLQKENWPGFRLTKGKFRHDENRDSPQAIQSLLEAIQATYQRPWWKFW